MTIYDTDSRNIGQDRGDGTRGSQPCKKTRALSREHIEVIAWERRTAYTGPKDVRSSVDPTE